MTQNRKAIARHALTAALETRVHTQRTLWDPICIYDLAEQLDVSVRFLDVPSMEGLYCKRPGPLILLPAGRPSSRQSYSCAHELGHHVAGHGTHADELLEATPEADRYLEDPDELFAECFAGFLLMPKMAVERAFARRGWPLESLTTKQVYTVAGLFGVGYTTLLNHMRWSLGILAARTADELLATTPQQIRRSWLNHNTNQKLTVVDRHWTGRPIDLRVGEFLLMPHGFSAESIEVRAIAETEAGVILEANSPGIGRLSLPEGEWASFVRVSRTNYVGLAKFRHLEETD